MNALNQKKDVILVMLDSSAAFDALDHSVLFHRLEHRFGVTGTVLNWFKSYLSNRTQCVSIKSLPNSKPVNLDCGIPQGSVLGPILFTLYTTPLEDIFKSNDIDSMFYADDTQLYVICNKPSDNVHIIENCLDEIRVWMKSNLLILYADKTEIIHFASRFKNNIEKLDSLRIGGSDIIPSHCIRNLGVYQESTGSISSHVNHISKSCFFSLHRLSKIRSCLNQSTTEKLVHAFITSRLDYCNSILYGCPENEIEKLQAIQNSAARLIKVKKKSDEITPILYDLHWLPIKERIVFKLLMFVYKILNNQAPMYLTLSIDLYVPGRTGLRSANPDLLLLQRKDTNVTNKTYGWRAFNICAPFLWN